MDAIILAGGLGTRLRTVVVDVPKCMAPVCGMPFIHYLLEYLKPYPINRIILSLGYLHEPVIAWIKERNYPFEFEFSIEEEPLGTGGAIKKALTKCKSEDVFILNGDTFFKVDLTKMHAFHKTHEADLSLALKPMVNFNRYGIVSTGEDHVIQAFKEKAYYKEGLINGGVYLLNVNSGLLNNLANKFSFESDVLEPMVHKSNFYGFVQNEYFIDIGIPEDFEKANVDFQNIFI